MEENDAIAEYVTRRTLLVRGARLGGAVALAGGIGSALAACGRSEESAETPETAAEFQGLSQSDVREASGSIKLLGWQYYEAPQLNAGSVKATWTYAGTAPELLTKTQQAGTFDVVISNNVQMAQFFAVDRLEPIDTSLLSNYEEIDPAAIEDPVWKGPDGLTYAIPFALQFSYVEWDSRKATKPTVFEDLLNPELKAKIGILDDPVTLFPLARLRGFEDPARLTESQFEELLGMLDQLKPQIATVHAVGAEVDLLARGDIVMDLPAFGSSVLFVREAGIEAEWAFFGSFTYADALSIVRGADAATAYNYIDHAVSIPAQVGVAEFAFSLPSVVAAYPQLPKELRQFGDQSEILAQAPITGTVPVEKQGDIVTIEEQTKAWNEFKQDLA